MHRGICIYSSLPSLNPYIVNFSHNIRTNLVRARGSLISQASFCSNVPHSSVDQDLHQDPVQEHVSQENSQNLDGSEATPNLPPSRSTVLRDKRISYARQAALRILADPSKFDSRQISHIIRSCGELEHLNEAIKVFKVILAAFRADSYIVESMIEACFSANQSQRVEEILLLLQQNGVEINDLVTNSLITGYCRAQQPDLAFEAFSLGQEKDMGISAKHNILVGALIDANKEKEYHFVLDAMAKTYEKYKLPNDATWNEVAKSSVKVGKMSLPFELYSKYSPSGDEKLLPPMFWSNIITAYFVKGQPDQAMEIFNRCKKNGAPDKQVYYVMMTNFTKLHRYDQVATLYDDIIANDIKADASLYTSAINAFSRAGLMDKAKEVVTTMRKADMVPTLGIYSVLLDGFVKAHEFNKAVSLLEEMKKDNLRPTVSMWSSIFFGIGKAKHFDRAYHILEELGKKNTLDSVTYPAVLRTLFKARLGEYSAQYLDEFQANVYDENLKSAIMSSMSNKVGSFEEILDEMDAAGLQPDEMMFNVLIDDCVRNRHVDQARTALERMQKQYSIQPSRITWCCFLKGLGSAGLVEEARKIFDEKIPIASRTQYEYNTIIHAMVKNNRLNLAIKYFDEMHLSGLEPSEITINIVMMGFGRAKELDQCFNLFNAFKKKLTMSAVSYNVLMSCCLMNKKPERAVDLVVSMKKDGVKPVSFLGWDVAHRGISQINKLEQSFELVHKDGSAGGYAELMKVCVECGRRDLVVKVNDMMAQAQVPWESIEKQLKGEPEVYEKVTMWLQEAGELPMTKQQLEKIDAYSGETPISPLFATAKS